MDESLAWLCIEELLKAMDVESDGDNGVRKTRLALTLISLVSNVSISIIPRVLEEVERVIEREKDLKAKEMLSHAVFEEIMERVGDLEKETAMKWWFKFASLG